MLKKRDIACFFSGLFTALTLGVLALVFALSTVSCPAAQSHAPSLVAPNPGQSQRLDSAALTGWLPTDLTGAPGTAPARLDGQAAPSASQNQK